MKRLNRRSFLTRTALATAAVSWTARSWSQVAGSNSDVRMGVIACGDRAGSHIGAWSKLEGVRLAALCDPDQARVAKYAQQHNGAAQFSDLRKMLESKEIDGVSIATPNHWHALAGIWAIQAGKDVYTEKPVSHNVFEGRQFVEAARKYKKIVQTGTQSRSSLGGIGEAVKWVREGNLGKIVIARGLCYKPRPSIGKVDAPQTPPADVNYDLWSGPAPLLPVMRKKFHYDWHWIWAYGNGDLGNQGIHQMDICRWFLGEMELAPLVVSAGGRLGYVDDGETANTQIIYQGYEKAPLIFEVRGLPESKDAKNMDRFLAPGVSEWRIADTGDAKKDLLQPGVACIIECEGGYVVVPNYNESHAFDKKGKHVRSFTKGNQDHFANFIKAVKSRRQEDLNADILEGHLSSALCHTGNISYQLGAKKSPDEIKEALKGQKGMEESFGRMAEHLAKNDVDITQEKITLGVPLKMNGKTEKFLGNEKANAMLTRNYRAPYVVPEKV